VLAFLGVSCCSTCTADEEGPVEATGEQQQQQDGAAADGAAPPAEQAANGEAT
jgi:hypothetical protein